MDSGVLVTEAGEGPTSPPDDGPLTPLLSHAWERDSERSERNRTAEKASSSSGASSGSSSDTDSGPTSAEESDDDEASSDESEPSEEKVADLVDTEEEQDHWYNSDVPYWYVTEEGAGTVVHNPVADLTFKKDAPPPVGGLWVHRVWGTLHIGFSEPGGKCEKLRCGRKGLNSTYIRVEGWPTDAHRCRHCFPNSG